MTTSSDAIRCPICNRKLPVSGLEGVVWVHCRHCKKTMRLDSKVLIDVR